MKPTLFVLTICTLVLVLFGLSVTGYDVELYSDVPLYSDDRNEPFEDRAVSTYAGKKEVVSVFGCFDDKTDIYFYVMRSNGLYGYLYKKQYKAIKNWVPRMARIGYLLDEPLASIQCLIMVPEFSRNDKGAG